MSVTKFLSQLGDFLAALPAAGGDMSGNIDMQGNIIINLPLPTNSGDAASKAYVDGVTVNILPACNLCADISEISGFSYNNGASGVGATLTAPSTGLMAFDGISVILGQRILVWSDDYMGGIYDVTTDGNFGGTGVLTRASTYDEPSEIIAGATVSVVSGGNYGGHQFMMTQTDAITIGTTPITYIDQFATSSFVTLDGPQTVTGQKTFTQVQLFSAGVLIGTAIYDSNAKEILSFTPVASAVNYLAIANAIATNTPYIEGKGSDTNVGVGLKTKGIGNIETLTQNENPQVWSSGTGFQHTTIWKAPNTAATRTINLQDKSGTLAFLDDITSISAMNYLGAFGTNGGTSLVITLLPQYSKYFVILENLNCSVSTTALYLRYVNAATNGDITSAVYNSSRIGTNGTAIGTDTILSNTSIPLSAALVNSTYNGGQFITSGIGSQRIHTICDLTGWTSIGVSSQKTSSIDVLPGVNINGFVLIPGAGTITCAAYVYGISL